ncbi:PAS domain S-box-containing protein [Parapedobacter composti]|uniref:histidine kinase n=1 Tax=Parapedobacter composti TaxID=623281 RepID=A0A1I1HRY6_9SPHI|nr:PAS domain S-box protein [Parapedobacter composti]SFC26694.1 PAS domain S-box-containing protein [Parapedobacter composti]
MKKKLSIHQDGEAYRAIVDNAPVMVWSASPDARRYFFNEGWLRFTGRALEEEQGDGWTEGVHPDDLPRCSATYKAAFDAREAYRMEYRLQRHDGSYCWVSDSGAPYYLADGTFAGYVGSCVDILNLMGSARRGKGAAAGTGVDKSHGFDVRQNETGFEERGGSNYLNRPYTFNDELGAVNEELAAVIEELRATNEDLEESEYKTRSIIANAPFPIAVYTGREMRIVEANQAIIDVWGKGNDIIGKRYAEVLPELEDQQIYEQLDTVFTTGIPFNARNQRVDLDIHGERKIFYFNYSFTPLKDRSGNIYGVMNTAADVTDVVLAKQQIEQSEKMLYNLILQAPVAMCFMTGPDHVVEVANRLMIELWGRPQEEVVNKPIFEGLPDARDQGLEQWVDHVYNTGETYQAYERPITLLRNGQIEVVYLSFVYQAYRDPHGTIIGVIAITTDVSAQVKAKIEVERAYEQSRLAKEAAQLGMFDLDIKSGKLEWDERCRELFGIYHNEPVTYEQDFVGGLHPDDRERVKVAVSNALDRAKTNGNYDVEYRAIGKENQQLRWIRAKGQVHFDRHDNPSRFIGTVLDITEQKLYEIRLKENAERKARLAAIVETSDDAIVSKTLQGIITSWNKAAERMFGYTPEEAIGQHISLIIPPDRIQEEDYIIGEIRSGNKVDHFNTVRMTKDGREIPLSITVSPLIDDSGQIIGASKIARDITEQTAAQASARRYTERLEIINSMVKSISEELDLKKTLQKLTDGTTALTGAKFGAFFYNESNEKGELHTLCTSSGLPIDIFKQMDMPSAVDVLRPAFSGEGAIRVDDITKAPRYGRNFPYQGMPEWHLPVVSYLAVPVSSRSGNVIGGLFFGHPEPGKFTADHENLIMSIAAQAAIALDNAKLYEEVKALNDKKNEFIGLASHELKTPLTSVNAYLQILERLPIDDKNKQFTQKALRQMKKLITLVNDLLDISKIEAGKLQLQMGEFDLKKLMEETIELIGHTNTKYHIKFEAAAKSCVIYSDAQRVEQVVTNLLTNAIKYSPDADEVRVSLECSADEVKVGVQDFGRGIPSSELPHIFSRFYRVEDITQSISGLGIGLYLCDEIITRLKGKLWVESELGKGSTFWFTLPVRGVQK